MNSDQRFKLMNVLLDEAAICHDRGDHEDCRALTIQYGVSIYHHGSHGR